MNHSVSSALLLGSLVLLASCGGEKPEEPWLGGATAAATDTATHPGSAGGTAVVPDVAAGATVVVMLEDGRIALPENGIPPGPVVVTVTNGGTQLHNLFVEGEGVARAAGDPLVTGAAMSFDVTFAEGREYVFYCPITGHRENGEEVKVTVTR